MTRMEACHDAVRAACAAHGPFDLVLGFSQGAAVAASILLHEQLAGQQATRKQGKMSDLASQPSLDKLPLFRAAVFICSPLPFSKSLQYGVDTRVSFGLPGTPTLEELGWGTDRMTEISAALLPSDARFLLPDTEELPPRDIDGEGGRDSEEHHGGFDGASTRCHGPFYQMFHPDSDPAAIISIPTAHIIGRRDKLWGEHSKVLADLCTPTGRSVYDFYGGHEIPKDEDVVADISDIIQTVAARAGL